jgi:hypothetical protein
MGVLAGLHVVVAYALLLFAGVLGVWGTYLYFRKAALNGAFRASYLMLGVLSVVQGLLGGVLFAGNARPHELLHVVYGIFAVIFVPGVFLYAQPAKSTADESADAGAEARHRRREAILLAGASWIVMVAYFRGIATG